MLQLMVKARRHKSPGCWLQLIEEALLIKRRASYHRLERKSFRNSRQAAPEIFTGASRGGTMAVVRTHKPDEDICAIVLAGGLSRRKDI
jgi:hypothetical protein